MNEDTRRLIRWMQGHGRDRRQDTVSVREPDVDAVFRALPTSRFLTGAGPEIRYAGRTYRFRLEGGVWIVTRSVKPGPRRRDAGLQ